MISNFPDLSVSMLLYQLDFHQTKVKKNHIKDIQQDAPTNTMMIFTDGSAQGNPGPTGSGVVIKNPRHHGSPIKLAKASYHFLWHNFLLYIVFIHSFIYSIYLCRVMVVHIDDFSYTRGYDIRHYNEISHCDYFRLQE